MQGYSSVHVNQEQPTKRIATNILKKSHFDNADKSQNFKFEFSKMNEWLPLLDAFVCTKLLEEHSNILEIGVHRGGWLITLAENNADTFAIGIDPYPNNDSLKNSFLSDVNRRNLQKRIVLYPNWQELMSGPHKKQKFSLIHIDGVHDEINVFEDLLLANNHLNENGIIVVDDIFYHSFPGVTAATFKFIQEFGYAPFLFTQKKIYLCKSSLYDQNYEKIENLFIDSQIPFEIDQTLSGQHSGYPQSNAIFGRSLIITDIDLGSKREFLRENKMPLKPFSIKEVIRRLTPPILFDVLKRLGSKLS